MLSLRVISKDMSPRFIAISLLWLAGIVFPETIEAQVVRGYVVDALSGDSLAGVHVSNVARGTGTVTSPSGYFRTVIRAEDSLRFSFTGYRPQTLAAPAGGWVIRLVPDTVLLPGISVRARRINLRRDTTAQPLRLPGVPFVENPVRAKPMTWTWGRKNFSEDAPVGSLLGGSVSGPISYFMRYEKDQKKYERERRAAVAQRGYRQALGDEATRTLLMREFQLADAEYDSLVMVFNREHLPLLAGKDPEAVTGLLFRFFSDALRAE